MGVVSTGMHACGHDAHTAIALGAATLLADEHFPGTVRLIFQPAEEVGDEEGISGAQRMVEDGAMQGVDALVGLHVDATKAVGDIAIDSGVSSAGVDTFYATIVGKGGHGAFPHRVVDPIHIAGHVILGLHTIVSRRLHPYEPAVISIGSIHAGEASNVIPERVEMSGTIRFLSPDVQKQLHAEIESKLEMARLMGGNYELKMELGYPPINNHPDIVALIRQVGADLLGEKRVLIPKKEMGAEDFGILAGEVPAAMFMLGCRIEGDERRHHSPTFDIDEDCLPIGAAILAETVVRFLRKGGQKEVKGNQI